MTATIPLFVELCAGTAALSLRLHKDGARPPVSRMGAKTGYADAILRVLGLHPGQRADRYLWCEPDPGVRLLLHAYRDARLAKAAATIIRSWKDEDPRALWERLRAEGPPRLPEGEVDAGEVARAVITGQWAYRWGSPESGFAEARTGSGSGEGHGDTADMLAARWGAAVEVPAATIAPDAREVDPREVARFALLWATSIRNKGPDNGCDLQKLCGAPSTGTFGAIIALPDVLPERFQSLPCPPAAITPDARTIDPPQLPPDTVVYIDPPYFNTTGYAHDLPRTEVVALARRWAEAGATVAISEAEPIPELVAEEWFAVEITGERVGQKRTFSKQQREWVTLNRRPAWTPPFQGSLFG